MSIPTTCHPGVVGVQFCTEPRKLGPGLRRDDNAVSAVFRSKRSGQQCAQAGIPSSLKAKTGLSKSSVQNALRHFKERGLLDPTVVATVSDPPRKPLRPWVR